MKKGQLKIKKFYLGIIILLATSGSILFFPINIGGRYTCFYHRIFDPYQLSSDHDVSHTIQDNIPGQETHTESSHQHSDLLDNYLHRYAFIWWGSVGLLALGIYLFLKVKKV
jgi:hypothetical protein